MTYILSMNWEKKEQVLWVMFATTVHLFHIYVNGGQQRECVWPEPSYSVSRGKLTHSFATHTVFWCFQKVEKGAMGANGLNINFIDVKILKIEETSHYNSTCRQRESGHKILKVLHFKWNLNVTFWRKGWKRVEWGAWSGTNKMS